MQEHPLPAFSYHEAGLIAMFFRDRLDSVRSTPWRPPTDGRDEIGMMSPDELRENAAQVACVTQWFKGFLEESDPRAPFMGGVDNRYLISKLGRLDEEQRARLFASVKRYFWLDWRIDQPSEAEALHQAGLIEEAMLPIAKQIERFDQKLREFERCTKAGTRRPSI
jgi:hypothetical protein